MDQRPTVLLVDDDEIARMALASMLRRTDLFGEIIEASDGEEAWSLLQDGVRPALCCCDLRMPNLDGVGLLRRARSDPLIASLPFVMISSSADAGSVREAAKSGANGFIVKPYSAAVVARLVEKVFKEARLRVEEPPSETRFRLGLSSSDVLRLTLRTKEDASQLLDELVADEEPTNEQMATLQRLKEACLMLGLHQCAYVLSLCLGETKEKVPAARVLREAERLLEARLSILQ